MENYVSLLQSDMLDYTGNTIILWVIGFIPQIVIALWLANWFYRYKDEDPRQAVF